MVPEAKLQPCFLQFLIRMVIGFHEKVNLQFCLGYFQLEFLLLDFINSVWINLDTWWHWLYGGREKVFRKDPREFLALPSYGELPGSRGNQSPAQADHTKSTMGGPRQPPPVYTYLYLTAPLLVLASLLPLICSATPTNIYSVCFSGFQLTASLLVISPLVACLPNIQTLQPAT